MTMTATLRTESGAPKILAKLAKQNVAAPSSKNFQNRRRISLRPHVKQILDVPTGTPAR
jgi:hypothetical protein